MITKFRNTVLKAMAILVVALSLSGCEKQQIISSEFVLGTVCTVKLFEQANASLYPIIFKRLREIDDRMSANKDGTEVEEINLNAGIRPVIVHEDLFYVIITALKYAELSKGAFDPTVGALVKLWDIGGDSQRIPQTEDIENTLQLVNWKDLVVDETDHSVYLRRSGMRLDLGAIAKGYAADEIVKILLQNHIKRAIIDLGGNIIAFGEKPGNLAWKVGIQDPSGLRGDYLGIVSIRNRTLVTSGVYERYFVQDGIRYHHILSTLDGYPIDNGLISVTIIASKSIDADGLSTTCFALGFESGKALIESLPDVQAVFVFNDATVKLTSGLAEIFQIQNNNYTLVNY